MLIRFLPSLRYGADKAFCDAWRKSRKVRRLEVVAQAVDAVVELSKIPVTD